MQAEGQPMTLSKFHRPKCKSTGYQQKFVPPSSVSDPNAINLTPLPRKADPLSDLENETKSPSHRVQSEWQKSKQTAFNQTSYTQATAFQDKAVKAEAIQKAKSNPTGQSKEQKKAKFQMPKIQMPPILADYNKPLSMNDKQMFGCYIQQVQEITVGKNRLEGTSERKKSKAKSKSVNKGPSIENLVYTPARAEFMQAFSFQETELNPQEGNFGMSSGFQQPSENNTLGQIDISVEKRVISNRYQQQNATLQKLYIKKDIKSQVPKNQQSKQQNGKKQKGTSNKRKLAPEKGSSRNLLKMKFPPTTEDDKDNESAGLVDKQERSKVVPYQKLQDNYSNLSAFLNKAESQLAAQHILQMNRTFKTGHMPGRENGCSGANKTFDGSFQRTTQKKLNEAQENDQLNMPGNRLPHADDARLNSAEGNGLADQEMLIEGEMSDQGGSTDVRNQEDQAVQREGTRMSCSLPRMKQRAARESNASRVETKSVNEVVEKSNQMYNASIMHLKNAMKQQPEVRPLSITSRHMSIAHGDQENQRASSKLQKDKTRLSNKTPNPDGQKFSQFSRETSPLHEKMADASHRLKKCNFDRKTPQNLAFLRGSFMQVEECQSNNDGTVSLVEKRRKVPNRDNTNSSVQRYSLPSHQVQDPISGRPSLAQNHEPEHQPISQNFHENNRHQNTSSSSLSGSVDAEEYDGSNFNQLDQQELSGIAKSKFIKNEMLDGQNLQKQMKHKRHKQMLLQDEETKKPFERKSFVNQKLEKIDKLNLSQKARTARTKSNTMVNNSEQTSKKQLHSNSGRGSPTHSMEQSGRRYQQLMAQTFIPDLAVLEKRITKLNKMPDQFNRMMNKRNNQSDQGVMSILKVSDEKLFVKEKASFASSPKVNDLSSSCLVKSFKQSPDQHNKSKQNFQELGFNSFASSLIRGQKKKVNFDLPSIPQTKTKSVLIDGNAKLENSSGSALQNAVSTSKE